MTNPGTVAGSLPRSEDWIAREIAAIQRRLRHLRAGGLVVTGDSSGDTATSITSTIGGDGSSIASAPGAVAVGANSVASGEDAVAVGGDTSPGNGASATGVAAIAMGRLARAAGDQSVSLGEETWVLSGLATAVGAQAQGFATGGTSVGAASLVDSGSDYGLAAGYGTLVQGAGGVALGCDASGTGARALDTNQFVLGTPNHIVIVKGMLVMADASGGLHQIVVSTGGALSTVAYP